MGTIASQQTMEDDRLSHSSTLATKALTSLATPLSGRTDCPNSATVTLFYWMTFNLVDIGH